MFKAFTDTEFGSDFIIKSSGWEAKGWIFLGYFIIKLSAVFCLKCIWFLDCSFINCCSQFASLRFSFTSADNDIKSKYIMNIEFIIIDLLIESLFINNNIVSVDKELFKIMRENSLDWVTFEAFDCFCYEWSNILIFVSWF